MFHRIPLGCGLALSFLSCSAEPPARPVRPGIEVLVADSLHLIRGARVGLLTNQTGIARDGTSDVDLLLQAGIRLTTLFSPEHGFRGVLDRPTVEHALDPGTGLPIYSLYGRVRAPTPQMLEEVDIVLVDLQDIGARPYTYISTALLTMQAARQGGRSVIVLDRPNPIGGVLVQGPLLDTAFATFVGMLPVPLRHGMTIGELARFGNTVLGIGADLSVIPVDGWSPDMWYDETGLPWVRPSLNMPDLESATHYSGLVLFEGTNLSVGRGTPIAFQVLGGPWLRPREVMDRVGDSPGVLLSDTVITPRQPSDGKYPDRAVPAIRLLVTDRSRYDPTRLGVALLVAVRETHPDSLVIRDEILDRLAGSDRLRRAVTAGTPLAEIWAGWEAATEASEGRLRREGLIYRR